MSAAFYLVQHSEIHETETLIIYLKKKMELPSIPYCH